MNKEQTSWLAAIMVVILGAITAYLFPTIFGTAAMLVAWLIIIRAVIEALRDE